MRKTMNKLLLCVLLIMAIHGIQAQKVYFWIDAGLKLDGGTGMFLNKAILDSYESEPKFGSLYGAGAKLGFNFGDYHAITVDGMYHWLSQKNSIGLADDKTRFVKHTSMNAIDIYGMYRYTRRLSYIELGVKYSMYSNILQSLEDVNVSKASTFFNTTNLSPVLGLGVNVAGSGAFTTIVGFRVGYGLHDMINEKGAEVHYFSLPLIPKDYTGTHPIFAEFVIEFNFGIGYYAKAACSKRPKFFGYRP